MSLLSISFLSHLNLSVCLCFYNIRLNSYMKMNNVYIQDIRRSMPGNMRASITKVPASSVYSVRPESAKTRTISASESPLATSSSASSEDIHTTNH